MKNGVKEIINRVVVLSIIIIAFVITLAIMLKYKTEGETNMPILLNKILIVSSAEAESKEDNGENKKWNMYINQYNDIYINLEKNYEYKKESIIKSISIQNINITQPEEGKIELYMPNSSEGKTFEYNDNLKIADSLTYKGAARDNPKTLEIANQGGKVLFRAVNRRIGEYVSDEDDEIHYDGTLLSKAGKNIEKLKAHISFDIVIKTDKRAYRGNVAIDIPTKGLDSGVGQETIEDFSNVVFKREKL